MATELQVTFDSADPGAGGVAAGSAGGIPVGLMRSRECAARSRLRERGRAGQAAGLDAQHLEAVIQREDLDVTSDRPLVPGDQLRPVVDLDRAGAASW